MSHQETCYRAADAFNSLSLIVTAVAIFFLDWFWLDRATSFGLAIFMAVSAVFLLRQSLIFLMMKEL